MSCISHPNTCPSSGDDEAVLLSKILQVLNNGGGGGGAGVSSISVNGGPAQTGAVSITTGGTVTSVNGDPGPAVMLDSGEVPEGANLYYTQARFDTAFAGKSTTNLAEGVNLYYTQARFDTAFGGKSTTNLAEGTNLYFTEARVRATVLTGFASALGTITAADSVLSAFGKTEGRLAALEAGTAGPFVLKAGDTMTGALTITPSVANTPPLVLNTGTLTSTQNSLAITTTYNNAAADFTTIFVDLTNTASSVSSFPIRVRIGGTNRFLVNKEGSTTISTVDVNTLVLAQTLSGAAALSNTTIQVTANTSGAPKLFLVALADTASGATTRLISAEAGTSFGTLVDRFYITKAGAGYLSSTITVAGFASMGPSLTPSANLDVNNSTTTTLSYFYSTTDGLATPVNFARIEIVPGASANDAVIRTTAGGTGLVSNLPHILKVGTGQSVGTDIVAQSVVFRSGQSTGTGIRGDILFQQSAPGASSATLNAYTTSWTINTAGALVATGGFPITAASITLSGTLSTAIATLTDAATIATNAALANHYRVTLGGNRTLGNPTNPYDGARIVYEFIQDGTGNRTIILDTKFKLGTDITGVTLSTAANVHDLMTVIYNLAMDRWLVVAFVRGYV